MTITLSERTAAHVSAYWYKTQDADLFLKEVFHRYSIEKIGAFTYSSNPASIRVLEKLGFHFVEEWEEDAVLSRYFELQK